MNNPRIKQLQDRIKDLQKLMIEEEQSPDRAQTYIDDLTESIDSCKQQLAWLKANPSGYEFVNGA